MTATLPPELRPTRLGAATVGAVKTMQRWTGAVRPVFDLFVRLWLAQTFFVSGLLKLANWDTALYLAEYEYPVSWVAPATAAVVGVTVEIVGAVLLALGLATRLGAAALLVLAVVIQIEYRALDVHLLWVALLGWYVCFGAGPISLDRAVSRGLADSALPFGALVVKGASLLTRCAGPLFEFALRLWLAASIVAWSGLQPEGPARLSGGSSLVARRGLAASEPTPILDAARHCGMAGGAARRRRADAGRH